MRDSPEPYQPPRYFRWHGSPGMLKILYLWRVRISLVHWMSCDSAHPRRFRKGPFVLWVPQMWKGSYPDTGRKWQFFLQLRPFKVGRKSLWLRVTWGY